MPRKKGGPGESPPHSSGDATLPDWLDPEGNCGKMWVLLMKAAVEGGTLPTNPFTLAKSIKSAVGTISQAYRDKDGHFVLKVRGEEKVEKLRRLDKLIDGTKVVVVEHPRLNQVKVVVTCHSVADMSDDELKNEEELQAQGVIDVRRFRKDGKPVPTMVITIRGTARRIVEESKKADKRKLLWHRWFCSGSLNSGSADNHRRSEKGTGGHASGPETRS